MDKKSEHFDHRLALVLPAYDPYKDAFDIFMDLFQKNWPDCPYPFIVANMHFDCDFPNIVDFRHIPCGDEKSFRRREMIAKNSVNAKYYIYLEEDRMFTKPVNTADIEQILDFMDENDIFYYRLNPSFFPKKKKHAFKGYSHHYQIPAKEPYGMSGATSIFRQDYDLILCQKFGDEYLVENGFLQESFETADEVIENVATDDRNVLHVLHCIEKSHWLPKAKRTLIRMGYSFENTTLPTLSAKNSIISDLKYTVGKCIPIKARHHIKNVLGKFGMKFSTKY